MKSLLLGSVVICWSSNANPVGQVLDLLQKLHDTVVADGEKEQKQYEAFAEWCEDQGKERQFQIKTGKSQVEDLSATIAKASADIDAINSRIADVSQSIAANEADLKAATKIRGSEHDTFKKEERELVDTVDTLRRARQLLGRQLQGRGGSFAQVPQAIKDLTSSLKVILDAALFSTQDTKQLRAFLQAAEGEDGVDAPAVQAYQSHSAGILDTLADMQEKAEGMLAEARKTEVNARHAFELLRQSLKDELSVQNDGLSSDKRQLAGASQVKATAEGDLAATSKDLGEDETYLKDLAQDCQQRAVDSEASAKSRAEEIQALEEAKRIIAEATGGASTRQYREFLQVATRNDVTYEKVEAAISGLGKKDNNFALTQLAGQIRSAVSMSADPFSKVKNLIKGMITRLLVQAQEESSHKAFCDKETADNEAKRNKLQRTTNKLSTRIEKATAAVARLKEEIAELHQALHNIANSQKEMDSMRAKEHDEFLKAKADFEQGLHGIRRALQVLREYYQNQGAFIQQPVVGVHSQARDSATGIVSMLEVVESDFARSLAEGEAAEDDAKSVYEKTTQENRVSTATKRSSAEGKQQEASRLELNINDSAGDRQGVQQELAAVLEYLEKLRPQCTTEPESYEDRKARREHEIEGLKDALDILENETAFSQESTSFLAVRHQVPIQ